MAANEGDLSLEEKKHLIVLARKAIELYVREGKRFNVSALSERLKEKQAAFVTLTKDGMLRGCIGHITAVQPLYEDVIENAINAATGDPRFPPVTEDELQRIEIEVSVLSPPKVLEAKNSQEILKKLAAGVDGVIIENMGRGATYLPQVWEQIPDKKEFLESLCRKAYLPKDCWKDEETKIHTYRVEAFKEKDF